MVRLAQSWETIPVTSLPVNRRETHRNDGKPRGPADVHDAASLATMLGPNAIMEELTRNPPFVVNKHCPVVNDQRPWPPPTSTWRSLRVWGSAGHGGASRRPRMDAQQPMQAGIPRRTAEGVAQAGPATAGRPIDLALKRMHYG